MMAAGKRPVPFRTRKLSPPAPMVLLPGGSGRVGYRRPNNFTQHTRCKHHAYSGCFAIRAPSIPRGVWVDPRIADNHTRTHHWCPPTNHVAGLLVKVHAGDFPPEQTATESGPFVNGYETSPAKIRIADNHDGTHYWRTPMKTPGGTTRRGATFQLGATEVAGTAHAATMTPPVRRKSSTGRRVRPRTPTDSTSTTRPTTHPRKPGAGPDSALRKTPGTPTMGAYPRTM